MVVGGFLSAGVTADQHYRLRWPDFYWETDPSMYSFLVVFNHFCVAHCNRFFSVSIFVHLFLSVI